MRKDKQLLLDEIKQKMDASTAMIITGYKSLPPNASWKLRELLGKQGSIFEVVRKRVFMKAAEQAGISLSADLLGGHVGVVFVNQPDAMEPTKVVTRFSSENGDMVRVLCGQLEGKLVSGTELVTLSKLPNIHDMRGILLGPFIAPMAQMLSVLDAAMAGPLSVDQKS